MPIKRARADAIVAAIKSEAAAINHDPRMMHWVARLSVFGSYLTDKPVLGDLDIGYSLIARWDRSSDDEYMAWRERFMSDFPPPDHIRRDFVQRLLWPEMSLLRRLRVGRGISFHDHGELDLLKCPHQELFSFTPGEVRQ